MFDQVVRELLTDADLPAADEPSSRPVPELLDEVAGLERLVQAAQARQQRLLVTVERTQLREDLAGGTPGKLCGVSTEFEVAEALGVSRGTAQRRLATAQTVVNDLPELLRLVGTGDGGGCGVDAGGQVRGRRDGRARPRAAPARGRRARRRGAAEAAAAR